MLTGAIRRPIATTLLTLGLALAGASAYLQLPASPLPQIDLATINVSAKLPGAGPETMAATVATPLERMLGQIAGVTEITSTSTLGSTNITLQFDMSRDSNSAARDVQAGINAARALLPTGLHSNPTYRKVNPADAPIMIIALTSSIYSIGQLYDYADSILGQTLSQVNGIGNVTIGGGAQPAVRIEANPQQLNRYGLDLETLRTAVVNANLNRPKGFWETGNQHWQIQANDQLKTAKEYLPLIISYQNMRAIRLSDVAQVQDSVLDVRNAGMVGNQRAVVLALFRQPGANIIATVDRVQALIPRLKAQIPKAIDLQVVMDRTPTIRASLAEVKRTLSVSVILVILVVFLFLRRITATLIPAITVPVALLGTGAVMYLAGFSLNNLSLMALTIATGFVVDDAIVVLENTARYIEGGMKPFQAACKGVQEVGFTVLSISLSLIAVFIPILLMDGMLGRLFREFAVTLSAAILVSLLVSLTTTPMLCSRWLSATHTHIRQPGRWYQLTERWFNAILLGYQRSLDWALAHSRLMLTLFGLVIMLNIYLYIFIPKEFFPQQDTGRLIAALRADQNTSFQSMEKTLVKFISHIQKDPAVDQVIGFTGGGQFNRAGIFISLKPLKERKLPANKVIARLRQSLSRETGATLFLQAIQDIHIGGRVSDSQYQYTLQSDNLSMLRIWTPKVQEALSKRPQLIDVNTDQETKGWESVLTFNRDAMARLGITQQQADSILNDAFGQRQISTIYNPLNQYHVVLEVAPQYRQSEESLKHIYVQSTQGKIVPLSAFARWERKSTTLSVNHQSQFAAATLSFNLPPNVPLSDATRAINEGLAEIGLPSSIHGSFQGTAKTFQSSLTNQVWLILAALLTMYIVLGMLYESLVHPLTILSTLPSAGVGALLALLVLGKQFDVMALIGVLLLIGIVKKNAIMMVDFAIRATREQGLNNKEAILQACKLRFRPIIMTTTTALFGALPLALGQGVGAEMRTPLGISIVGGLILSQLLTLYTTPVVYLTLDKLRLQFQAQWQAK